MNLFSPAALRERVLEPLNASLPAPAPADHRALGSVGLLRLGRRLRAAVVSLDSQPFVIGAAEGVHGLGRER